jgi:serine/threonine protein kinase
MMTGKIGKYEILELVGSGATADVYHARDTYLGREVALKLLKPALVTDPQAFQRFVREAQTAASLFHSHIATVLDMGEADGRYFIVMRYIDGLSLDKIIRQQGPLSAGETTRMAREIGDALGFAHKQGFLHRDIKPSNILRDQEGTYWLSDFGLTKAMMSTNLTSHTGAVLGTPAYIAPEIWLGEAASPAADQYALACVVAECLTGRVLFDGETPPAVMTNHVLKGPVGLTALSPDTPQEYRAVLEQALQRKPEDRYSSILVFVEALTQIGQQNTARTKDNQLDSRAHEPWIQLPSPETGQSFSSPVTVNNLDKKTGQRRINWTAGAVVVLVLVVLVVIFLLKPGNTSERTGTATASLGSFTPITDAAVAVTASAVLPATQTATESATRPPTFTPEPTQTQPPTLTPTPDGPVAPTNLNVQITGLNTSKGPTCSMMILWNHPQSDAHFVVTWKNLSRNTTYTIRGYSWVKDHFVTTQTGMYYEGADGTFFAPLYPGDNIQVSVKTAVDGNGGVVYSQEVLASSVCP